MSAVLSPRADTVMARGAQALSMSDVASQSWARCIEAHGLRPDGRPRPLCYDGALLAERQARLSDLVACARHEMTTLFQQLADPFSTVVLTDTDGSETLSIRLDNIPVGAVLSNTAGDILTISGGSIVLTPDQLAGLAITPPANSHDTFNLNVTAIAVDGSAAPASTATTLAVTVNPVNDAPEASDESSRA